MPTDETPIPWRTR